MKLPFPFSPKPTLTEAEVNRGLRLMTMEGIASMGYGSITTSGFLAAYALVLGANNLQIGLLAAIPFLTQPLQLPFIPLIERMRRRKMLATFSWWFAQVLWIPIALIPLALDVPSAGAVAYLLGLMAFRALLTPLTNVAWNSWVRDLVPQQMLGRFYARRLASASIAAMLFGLAAAFFVDFWEARSLPEDAAFGYTIQLLAGALTLGFASPLFMSLMPEPMMQVPTGPKPSLISGLMAPVRDKNFRVLVRFQFLWGFAINLAVPFFTVYMLQRIGLPLSVVIGFSMLSQAANVLFLRVWGPLADKFGSKAVLQLSATLYVLVVLVWTFTTMPERYFLTIPLLVILHIMAGTAAAGVNLTAGTIGMKLAPQGQATTYLAVVSLAANLGAGLGPLLGGRFADFFSVRSLSVNLEWIDPFRTVEFSTLNLTGFDFLFGITFLLGLFTINSLAGLREEGEAESGVVMDALIDPVRALSRSMHGIPGLGILAQFPYGFLRRMPVPGLDVAIGVTLYQVAETARLAALATHRGRAAASHVIDSVARVVSDLIPDEGLEPEMGAEVARQTARGTLLSLGDVPRNLRQLTRHTLEGVIRGLEKTGMPPEEALAAAAYGATQGALEAGIGATEASQEALDAARQIAEELPADTDTTVEEVRRAVEQAVEESRHSPTIGDVEPLNGASGSGDFTT